MLKQVITKKGVSICDRCRMQNLGRKDLALFAKNLQYFKGTYFLPHGFNGEQAEVVMCRIPYSSNYFCLYINETEIPDYCLYKLEHMMENQIYKEIPVRKTK